MQSMQQSGAAQPAPSAQPAPQQQQAQSTPVVQQGATVKITDWAAI